MLKAPNTLYPLIVPTGAPAKRVNFDHFRIKVSRGSLSKKAVEFGSFQGPTFVDAEIDLQLSIQNPEAPTITISGRIYETGNNYMLRADNRLMRLDYRVQFCVTEHLIADSLDLGFVADNPLISAAANLPRGVTEQLKDPSQIPENLHYLSFRFNEVMSEGFDNFPNPEQCLQDDTSFNEEACIFFTFFGFLASGGADTVELWFLHKDAQHAANINNIFSKMEKAHGGQLKTKQWKNREHLWERVVIEGGKMAWKLKDTLG